MRSNHPRAVSRSVCLAALALLLPLAACAHATANPGEGTSPTRALAQATASGMRYRIITTDGLSYQGTVRREPDGFLIASQPVDPGSVDQICKQITPAPSATRVLLLGAASAAGLVAFQRAARSVSDVDDQSEDADVKWAVGGALFGSFVGLLAGQGRPEWVSQWTRPARASDAPTCAGAAD